MAVSDNFFQILNPKLKEYLFSTSTTPHRFTMIKRFSFKNKKQQSTRMTISSNSQNPNIETILRSQKISTTEDSAEKKKKKNKKFLKKFLKLRSASKFRSPFQSGGKGVPESSKQPDTEEKKRQKKTAEKFGP